MTALSSSITGLPLPAHFSSAPFGMTGLVANQPHGQLRREEIFFFFLNHSLGFLIRCCNTQEQTPILTTKQQVLLSGVSYLPYSRASNTHAIPILLSWNCYAVGRQESLLLRISPLWKSRKCSFALTQSLIKSA